MSDVLYLLLWSSHACCNQNLYINAYHCKAVVLVISQFHFISSPFKWSSSITKLNNCLTHTVGFRSRHTCFLLFLAVILQPWICSHYITALTAFYLGGNPFSGNIQTLLKILQTTATSNSSYEYSLNKRPDQNRVWLMNWLLPANTVYKNSKYVYM